MRSNRNIKVMLVAIFFLLPVGLVLGYHEYIDRFEGNTHGDCHSGSKTDMSVAGYVDLSVDPDGKLDPYEEFTLTLRQ